MANLPGYPVRAVTCDELDEMRTTIYKLTAENEQLREKFNTLLDQFSQKLAEVQFWSKQVIEWRGTIRETGYDGAREIVNAYKNLRSILILARANLSESDTSTFGKAVKQKIDDALGRME